MLVFCFACFAFIPEFRKQSSEKQKVKNLKNSKINFLKFQNRTRLKEIAIEFATLTKFRVYF